MSREGKIKATVKPTSIKSTNKSTKHASGKQGFVKDRSVRTEAIGFLPETFFSYNAVDDNNVLAIIDLVRTGITYRDFNKIVGDTPFSLTEWANYLQLSKRTIQRNQKEKKSFQPIQSERIVELSMLYQYGVEVFGDKDNFNTWLNSKLITLGGRTPKELLDTKFGIGMVRDELGRIEHGILA
jgi:putative toxin-antitoxin system antitoxin component (TIGR02293 family)